jgi:hypothetical protein
MRIARRARGVAVTAILWAAAWGLVGIALGVLLWAFTGPHADPGAVVLGAARWWATLGAVGGAAFALVLTAAERRAPSLHALSAGRIARWGAFGGAVPPLLLLPVLWAAHSGALGFGALFVPLGAALGAGSAAGSLGLARRVPGRLAPACAGRGLAAPGA